MAARLCPGFAGERCVRLVQAPRVRCDEHETAYAEARGSTTSRGYDGAYRRARAELLASHPLCAWGCGQPATTADHVPSLEELRRAGLPAGEAELVPACEECNYGRAAHLI